MPLLAALFAGTMRFVMASFIYVFGVQQGIKWAERAFVAAIAVAFFVAVGVCVSSLLGTISAGMSGLSGWLAKFWMGVGMFIPSNASAVIACVASVWLACVVWRTKIAVMKVG